MRELFSALSMATMLILGAQATPANAAQTVTSEKFGYRISVPDGWTVIQDKEDPDTIGAALPTAEGLALCVATGSPVDHPQPLTQAEINAANRTPLTKEFWAEATAADFKDPIVETTGSRMHPSGIQTQEGIIAYNDKNSGAPMKVKMVLFVAVKETYTVVCGSPRNAFASHLPAFEGVIDSFAPKGVLVGENPPPVPPVQIVSIRDLGGDWRGAVVSASTKFSKSTATKGAAKP